MVVVEVNAKLGDNVSLSVPYRAEAVCLYCPITHVYSIIDYLVAYRMRNIARFVHETLMKMLGFRLGTVVIFTGQASKQYEDLVSDRVIL